MTGNGCISFYQSSMNYNYHQKLRPHMSYAIQNQIQAVWLTNLRIKCVSETWVFFTKNLAFLHDSHFWLWGFFKFLAALAHGTAQLIYRWEGSSKNKWILARSTVLSFLHPLLMSIRSRLIGWEDQGGVVLHRLEMSSPTIHNSKFTMG